MVGNKFKMEVNIGDKFIGKINGKPIEILDVRKDKYTGSKTVIYRSNNHVSEYGYDAFIRCFLERMN